MASQVVTNSLLSPLQDVLDSGESLLWSGQPKQGIRLQTQDIFMIPFSLMWGGFAIFWEASALKIPHNLHHTNAPGAFAWIFPLWGIPFVLIGLYIIFGRFFYDAAARKRTYYGLTETRVIVLKTLINRTISSYNTNHLAALNLVERGDKSGDILFGNPGPWPNIGSGSWPGSGRYAAPGFYLLPEAREVYNLIRQAQDRK